MHVQKGFLIDVIDDRSVHRSQICMPTTKEDLILMLVLANVSGILLTRVQSSGGLSPKSGSHDLHVPYVECSPLTTSSLFVSRHLYQMAGWWMAGRWSAEQLGSPGVTIIELIARTELTLD